MAANLKFSTNALESAFSFSLKKLKKPTLKSKTKKQKALEALVIQKRYVLAVKFGAANQKSYRNGFYQL